VGSFVTLGVSVFPFVHFGYHAPGLHIVFNTTEALIAVLAAYLVYGRFRERGGLQDLLLVYALLLFAVANLPLSALPLSVRDEADSRIGVWAPLVVRLAATSLLAVAAFVPPDRPVRTQQVARRAVETVVLLAGLLVLLAAIEPYLPTAVDPRLSPVSSGRPRLVGHPLLLATQAVGFLLFAFGAVRFTREADRRGDEFLRWLGAGCALGAFARLNYALFPSLYTEWFYVGDVLRAGFYLLLLVGAVREIRSYWAVREQLAVLEERRRLARDLHDGVVQELSYIRGQLGGEDQTAPVLRRALGATDRALDEARGVIAALARPMDAGLAGMLGQAAEEVAARHGVSVESRVDEHIQVDADQREQLVRIVREAVGNAARHSGAELIRVRLAGGDGCAELVVADEGRGFDPGSPSSGFGLTSMRERAQALGGDLQLSSTPGRGTVVHVRWSP
jgi:signal transduction histidine kinase